MKAEILAQYSPDNPDKIEGPQPIMKLTSCEEINGFKLSNICINKIYDNILTYFLIKYSILNI